MTFGDYEMVARQAADARGIGRGDRVLIDTSTVEEPMFWLMAPLSVGASVVLCANLDRTRLDDRVAAERANRVFV
jgi:hypothetical protein